MGFIGVELAQALARLGLDVAGFDAVETVAGIDDPEVLEALRPRLSSEFALYLGGAAELEEAGDAIRVSGAGGAFEADAILAAMGRRPNVEGLGLDTLGVPLDDRGMPEIDPETLRIGGLDVFLAGDANGYRPLLHEAADEGYIAGRMANPEVDCNGLCRRTPLSVTFCDPQVARVGPPLSELEGRDIVSATADFSGQGRARLSAASGGILRVHADRRTGRLLAAEMCAPAAEHLAHLLALAVEREITVAGMLAMPVYHPVLEEGLRSALRDLARQVPPSEGPDLSECPDIGHAALD
jgi:dihydrolipoamide dehydrogenase